MTPDSDRAIDRTSASAIPSGILSAVTVSEQIASSAGDEGRGRGLEPDYRLTGKITGWPAVPKARRSSSAVSPYSARKAGSWWCKMGWLSAASVTGVARPARASA